MGTHRVVNKVHARVHPDGKVEQFNIGDEIDPTESEMEAFPDKFERVDGKEEPVEVDDSAPKLSSEAATKPDIELTPDTVTARPRRSQSSPDEDKGRGSKN